MCVAELWPLSADRMGVNHDQFSHFPRLRPGSPALILQMVLILAQIVSLVVLQIGLGSRGRCMLVALCRQLVVELCR